MRATKEDTTIAKVKEIAVSLNNVPDIPSIKIKGKKTATKTSFVEIIEKVATALSEEKAVGWMQGRMEFGPRALGGRSIIADPRSPLMQKMLNLKVKYRESFRPFAPSVLREKTKEWFEHDPAMVQKWSNSGAHMV